MWAVLGRRVYGNELFSAYEWGEYTMRLQAESIMQAAGDDARLYGKAAIRYVALGAYCDAGVAKKSRSDRRPWLNAGWQCEFYGSRSISHTDSFVCCRE